MKTGSAGCQPATIAGRSKTAEEKPVYPYREHVRFYAGDGVWIKGDPKMSQKTKNALLEMVNLAKKAQEENQ